MQLEQDKWQHVFVLSLNKQILSEMDLISYELK